MYCAEKKIEIIKFKLEN